ncbi:MAG: hypothetical protein MMC23_002110 [Stictis urceolatum]|nr:hypothetical protein [Stictis urceolata]
MSTPTPNPSSTPSGPADASATGPQSLTPLEQEVLEEYAKLLDNLNQLSPLLSSLSTTPTAAVLDGLRMLERKTSLVSTLLKASVYSIVLQQQMLEGEGDGDGASESEGGSRQG